MTTGFLRPAGFFLLPCFSSFGPAHFITEMWKHKRPAHHRAFGLFGGPNNIRSNKPDSISSTVLPARALPAEATDPAGLSAG